MIQYRDNLEGITPDLLRGFFVGWTNPPSADTHLSLLRSSDRVELAIDDGTGGVVGFATALTDQVLSAYIPLLEVLPEYQNQGIGRELVSRLLIRLNHLYMIDLLCDPDVQPFYDRLGM